MVEHKKVIIVSEHHIPFGGAQSNRILSYARGLQELKNDVKILETIPRDLTSLNKKNSGIVFGVKFKYFDTIDYNKARLFSKLFRYFTTLNKVMLHVLMYKLNNNFVIILQDNKFVSRFGILVLCKVLNIKVFRDISEYPDYVINRKLGICSAINSRINFFLELHMFEGLFFMTHFIRNYYLKYNSRLNHILLPMTVEPDRFNLNKIPVENRYIAYCGSMYTDKDGVPILIKSFDKIASQFDDMNLMLIGDNSDKKRFEAINSVVQQSAFKSRIILTGKVNRNDIPELLNSACILALSRPANKQAEGGFPTKLGEYLATGKPVLVTSVGDIPKYLIDNVNAFIAKPGDIDDFAHKITLILTNYDKAIEVGSAGQELTKTIFNYQFQAERIIRFINNT